MEFPIEINVDNVGAICLSNNGGGKRMRHVDIQGFYIRDFVEDGIVKVKFVKSVDNKSDAYTKNVDAKTYIDNHGCYMIEKNDDLCNDRCDDR